jgi:hypothetical protein
MRVEEMSTRKAAGNFGHDLAEIVDQLRAHFFQWREINPTGAIYVLLDQNRPVKEHDELHRARLARREVKREMHPVPRPDLAHEPDTLPLLLQIYAPRESGYVDEALLELTLRNALQRCRSVNGAYVAGWLCSDAPMNELANHLASAGVVFAAGEARQRFVPLFEPYRMALLVGDEQAAPFLSGWLGPIKHWLFVDSAGALRSLGSAHSAPRASKHLPRHQLEMQARIGVARLVVMALEKTGVLLATQAEQQIDQAIEGAQRHGLNIDEDVIFYALNNFTLGTAWASHPRALAMIEKTATDPELRLAAQMAALPDDLLEQIASGAPASN